MTGFMVYLFGHPWYLWVGVGVIGSALWTGYMRRRRMERRVAKEFISTLHPTVVEAAETAAQYHLACEQMVADRGREWRPSKLIERGQRALHIADDVRRLTGGESVYVDKA